MNDWYKEFERGNQDTKKSLSLEKVLRRLGHTVKSNKIEKEKVESNESSFDDSEELPFEEKKPISMSCKKNHRNPIMLKRKATIFEP